RLCADRDHAVFNVAEHEAIRHVQSVAISAKAADCAGQQRGGDRLQRDQGLWRKDQCEANGPSDRDSPVLDKSPFGLSALDAPARDRKADGCPRQRTLHGARGGWTQRRDHRCVEQKIPLHLRAADHGNSHRRLDGNPATDSEATWQPIANTPMHPEYPCSHCIQSGSVAAVVKAVLGGEDIPEVALTSPTAPGVTHRWTNMATFTEEVANARIWAGFHYRFSTHVGTDMGLQIGEYVVKNVMEPVVTSSR